MHSLSTALAKSRQALACTCTKSTHVLCGHVIEGCRCLTRPAHWAQLLQASLEPSARPPREAPEGAEGYASGDAAVAASGLQNLIGEYNCFLNVILQCLWHCREFQHAFMAQDARHLQARLILLSRGVFPAHRDAGLRQ